MKFLSVIFFYFYLISCRISYEIDVAAYFEHNVWDIRNQNNRLIANPNLDHIHLSYSKVSNEIISSDKVNYDIENNKVCMCLNWLGFINEIKQNRTILLQYDFSDNNNTSTFDVYITKRYASLEMENKDHVSLKTLLNTFDLEQLKKSLFRFLKDLKENVNISELKDFITTSFDVLKYKLFFYKNYVECQDAVFKIYKEVELNHRNLESTFKNFIDLFCKTKGKFFDEVKGNEKIMCRIYNDAYKAIADAHNFINGFSKNFEAIIPKTIIYNQVLSESEIINVYKSIEILIDINFEDSEIILYDEHEIALEGLQIHKRINNSIFLPVEDIKKSKVYYVEVICGKSTTKTIYLRQYL
ncbi:hypothetical protein NGRA_1154 [Nosema granulosis]|uniref:Uncharacterized protein n=1 Tax=Nosema granulosis TaxID=83296 RepID=A0A9P6H1P8_9MICR|nr:hypothetical protein NGRA_1154 [Nosema granulosis]